MATWGEFIAEMPIVRLKDSKQMYVKVDDAIDLFDARNKHRAEAQQLELQVQQLEVQVQQFQLQLAQEREACALELEEFARACEEESSQPEYSAILRAAAGMIRERGQTQADGEEPVVAELVDLPPEESGAPV